MDDFGSGHSSLSYLRTFSFDVLKIDRSFVKGIAARARDYAIAWAILEMAHTLELKVVAKGVETPEQEAVLRSGGCDLMQGFLYSPAVAPEELDRFVQGGPPRPGPGIPTGGTSAEASPAI
jgi:EAL domain-containing protein (putative c-di-GMP-specific phosphodiesterase class I)